MMVSTIKLNTDKCVEVVINTLKVQTASIAMNMGAMAMAMESQLSNQHLQPIAQYLVAILPNFQLTTIQSATCQCTMKEHHLNSKSFWAFTTHHQQTIITKATTYTMNSSLMSSHQWPDLLALCVIYIYINKELKLLP
jgi:H+/gluconate symporter-like permease